MTISRIITPFRRVVIESPYAGDIKANMAYLKIAMYDSIMRGEAPIASHKLYTDVLDDNDPEQRRLGIELGLSWLKVCDLVAFYTDLGMSPGMAACLGELKSLRFRVPFEMRKVREDVLSSIG